MKAALLDRKTVNWSDSHLSQLSDKFVSLDIYDTTTDDQLIDRCLDVDVIFTNKVILHRPQLEKLPNLKYIGILATGTNNVDLQFAEERKIKVKNAVGYSTESVAQHTLGFILNFSGQYHRYVPEQKLWPDSPTFCRQEYPAFELSGKTLGIIGYGTIGKRVKELAEAFGMQVFVAESLTGSNIAHRIPLDDLLCSSDFVSLHGPLTEESKGLVDNEFLSKMKPTAFLINTSRGPIVNEQDLANALSEHVIAGAGLDVLSEEPPKKDNPLIQLKHDNLIITPHVAWASNEAQNRLFTITIKNIDAAQLSQNI